MRPRADELRYAGAQPAGQGRAYPGTRRGRARQRGTLPPLAQTGKDPSEVAGIAVDAIRDGQLYILTSANRNEAALRRAEGILAGAPPRPSPDLARSCAGDADRVSSHAQLAAPDALSCALGTDRLRVA
jgi:hypothetical protein